MKWGQARGEKNERENAGRVELRRVEYAVAEIASCRVATPEN